MLTFFGLMHGEAIGINQTPFVTTSYLVVGTILVGCARFAMATAAAPVIETPAEPLGALATE